MGGDLPGDVVRVCCQGVLSGGVVRRVLPRGVVSRVLCVVTGVLFGVLSGCNKKHCC